MNRQEKINQEVKSFMTKYGEHVFEMSKEELIDNIEERFAAFENMSKESQDEVKKKLDKIYEEKRTQRIIKEINEEYEEEEARWKKYGEVAL